ncbi:hypothetical protein BU16DRAFT_527289 [Lophium mytilinum]|uniref:Uncharacterized protein n=1 Tax=Lophium mytilinum TaxID=390894 RepID=A0A6A6QSR1_9PEZI|nr:hypothetical protein BU16DRAFT_527289 [Lophium mytilinum]
MEYKDITETISSLRIWSSSQTLRLLSSSDRHHQRPRSRDTRTVPVPTRSHSTREHQSSSSRTPTQRVARVVPAPTRRQSAVPAPSQVRSSTYTTSRYTPVAHPVQARSNTKARGPYEAPIPPRRDRSDFTAQHRRRDGDIEVRYTRERRVVPEYDEPRQKEERVRIIVLS